MDGVEEPQSPRVLILGAGVNGASVARELALNGVSTWVVDAHDLAFGASSKSSRLIHGGLRYLEFGEFALVRESLEERARLRRLAPQFVRPLRLHIPVQHRVSGLLAAGFKFLSRGRAGWLQRMSGRFRASRGLWLVRLGLWLYDRFAASGDFPPHEVHRMGDSGAPALNRAKFRWTCSYSDAQMWDTERFVVALLRDAAAAAQEWNCGFRVWTYASAEWDGEHVVVRPTGRGRPAIASSEAEVCRLRPEVIVNATGAWGDRTLQGLRIAAPPLFGGTKGSHFITGNRGLVEALKGTAVYAEADDGRLVFVIPYQESVLVGTTDERFEGSPEQAVATPAEIEYLLGLVSELFPQVTLSQDDVIMQYSGVRPLPRAVGATAAISRDHAIVPQQMGETSILTLVGGKLTTCRAFGELVADEVFRRLNVRRQQGTRDRMVPGGSDSPENSNLQRDAAQALAGMAGISITAAEAVFARFGSESRPILAEILAESPAGSEQWAPLAGIPLPTAVVKWIIQHEWVQTLEDLVERRLGLVFALRLQRSTIEALANCLIECGRLRVEERDAAVTASVFRLQRFYGRKVE